MANPGHRNGRDYNTLEEVCGWLQAASFADRSMSKSGPSPEILMASTILVARRIPFASWSGFVQGSRLRFCASAVEHGRTVAPFCNRRILSLDKAIRFPILHIWGLRSPHEATC
jgi:hypothetical protein